MSIQQDRYLTERANGKLVDEACHWSGITPTEAKLIEKEIESGNLTLPAPRDHNQPKENIMAESVAADELRLLIERVERLEEEKKGLSDDIRDVYNEAKARGYDTKTMRAVIRLRKMETHTRQEAEALLETYKAALGMDYAETPLGAASIARNFRDSMDKIGGIDKVSVGAPGEEPTTIYEREVSH